MNDIIDPISKNEECVPKSQSLQLSELIHNAGMIFHHLVKFNMYRYIHILLNLFCFYIILFISFGDQPIDPFRGTGTTYLHGDTLDETNRKGLDSNSASGAIVVPISLATTFQQKNPGQPRAKDDPNSFGMGYEYSRTGKLERA